MILLAEVVNKRVCADNLTFKTIVCKSQTFLIHTDYASPPFVRSMRVFLIYLSEVRICSEELMINALVSLATGIALYV